MPWKKKDRKISIVNILLATRKKNLQMKRNESHMTGIDKQCRWRKRGRRTNSKQYQQGFNAMFVARIFIGFARTTSKFPFAIRRHISDLPTIPLRICNSRAMGEWQFKYIVYKCVDVRTIIMPKAIILLKVP